MDSELISFRQKLAQQFRGYTCRSMDPNAPSGGEVWRTMCGPFVCVIVDTYNTVSKRPALAGEWYDTGSILMPMSGAILVDQYDRSIRIDSGELYLMDPREPCEIFVPKTARVASIMMDRLSVLGPEALSGEVFGTKFSKVGGLPNVLHSLLTTMHADDHEYDLDEKFTVSEAVLSILGKLIEHDKDRALITTSSQGSQRSKAIQRWIIKHADDPALDVPMIAKEFNLSRSSIYRLFAVWGHTPQSWIFKQRLINARNRLVDPHFSSSSISEICFDSGFNSSAHFSRAFRAEFNQSPREYRSRAMSD